MLIAMNNDGRYLCPSVEHPLLSPAVATAEIIALRRECSGNEWFCPHCYEASKGEDKHPVSLVNPKARIIHFRHKNGDRSQQCSKANGGESEKHLAAKLAVQASLSTDERIATLESRKFDDVGNYRVADVAATDLMGNEFAYEIQVSRIDSATLQERTEALMSVGFDQVHWYLHGSNYRDENVNYLINTENAYCYRLSFDSDGMPTWNAISTQIKRQAKKPLKRNSIQENDTVEIMSGSRKGTTGVVKDIGNLFGAGNVISIDIGLSLWVDYPARVIKKVYAPASQPTGDLSRV